MALKDFLYAALFYLLLQSENSEWTNVASAQNSREVIKDPVTYYTTVELACSEGYPIQEHKIVTKDGYILTVHRMPNGRTRPAVPPSKNHYFKIHLKHHPDFDDCVKESINETSTGFPVLFVHGVLMASDGWLLQGTGYDLAYLMADGGFDVWMLNVRGNFYSRKHKTLSPSDPKFWDFSFHENAVLDLPATIDYILKVTGEEKVGYLGFSMGATIFFAMASTLPEYNNKILGFVGLAPVVFIREEYMNPRKKVMFSILSRITKELQKKRNVHELFPRNTRLVTFGRNYCSKDSQLQDFCYDLLTVFLGYHSKLVLRNKLHLYATHVPTGTSIKTLIHYLQNWEGNCFKPFDYGSANNVQIYGTSTPPDYPLGNVTTPVALYYSKNDFYYDVKDINDLQTLLPKVIDIDIKSKFNHADYLWSFKAREILYPKVLSFYKTLNGQYYFQFRPKKTDSDEDES